MNSINNTTNIIRPSSPPVTLLEEINTLAHTILEILEDSFNELEDQCLDDTFGLSEIKDLSESITKDTETWLQQNER